MVSLTDEAIFRMQRMIVSGELTPGQRLPPEKELSESLGLSRSSLREAVKALEIMRVLDVRRGDGTYVTSLEPALLLEAMTFVVDMHNDRSLVELLEVRRILEPAAAVLATARATEEQLDALETIIGQVDADTPVEELVAQDLEFHASLAQVGGNEYLAGLLASLSSKTVRIRVWRGLTQSGSVQRTLDEHAGIVAAVRSRDPYLVQALVVAHIAGVEHWLQDSLGSSEDPPSP
jgi:GntR family transcriptional repressor for pyruvate dehydrogenase complex